MYLRLAIAFLLPAFAVCQRIQVVNAPRLEMPGQVDSNSPAFWQNGRFHLVNSTGIGPLLSTGADQFHLGNSTLSTIVRPDRDWPTWIEALWLDPSGTLIAWYHQEHEYICNGKQRPNMPRIGAALSYDGGKTFWDQGIVLSSPYAADCSAQNGYFAGGHGDFSVVLDRQQEYFYFLFSNYGGPVETQGVAIARMAFGDRFRPSGTVRKYHKGDWTQAGIGGQISPIFPTTVSWKQGDADSFWGPSVHWNTHLQSFVILMNRSCCSPGWPQEGLYAAFNPDISHPEGWSEPVKILSDVFWYPQVLGLGAGETDSLAGQRARLYVFGESKWELQFIRDDENLIEEPETAPEPESEPESEPEPQPELETPSETEVPTPPEPEPQPEPSQPEVP